MPSLTLAHCNEIAAARVVPNQIDDELHFRRPCLLGNRERRELFHCVSAVEKAGLSSLNEGTKVSYEEVGNRGKTSAENLRVG